MEACADCGFVVQLWHNVVGLYDYTLLLEYCPYGTLQTMLNVSWGDRERVHLIGERRERCTMSGMNESTAERESTAELASCGAQNQTLSRYTEVHHGQYLDNWAGP